MPRAAHRLQRLLLVAAFAVLAATLPARAHRPGGGDGSGPDVTLHNNGDGTVTLANGLVTAVINTSTAQVLRLIYHGLQITEFGRRGTSAFYWQGGDQIGGEQTGSNCTYAVVTAPSANGGNSAEISLLDRYTNHPATAQCADADFRFAMFRGSPGLYVAEIMSRPATYPAGGGRPFSLTCKLGANIFDWLSEDTGRDTAMPSTADLGNATAGVNSSPKEVKLLTTGRFAGQFDCKYDYSGQLGVLNVTGWISTASRIGFWAVWPSHEFFAGGPMHRELLAQMMLINNPFFGGHFGFHPDLAFHAGETWSKVYGPFLLYFNSVPAGSANPPSLLFADACAQAAAEHAAWPYAWFHDPNFVPASGRAAVSGRIIIADPGNPNASAADLWVGLSQTPPSDSSNTDFQFFAKNYQFWVKTGPSGNFTIPNVIASANYTLFAFGPGAIGQFQSQLLPGPPPPVAVSTPLKPFAVNVAPGSSVQLGSVTWSPPRVGPTVWEIGVPDRDTLEFRHGDDYWHGDLGNATHPAVNWAPFQNYAADFPGGLVYTVGQSVWARDWNYAQPTIHDLSGNFVGTTQKIRFTLPQAPADSAQASLYFAFAADFQGPIIVTVNDVNVTTPANGFMPAYGSNAHACDAMIRMGSQGVFCDYRLNFPAKLLHAGLNEISLHMRKGGYFSDDAMYDYLRLELSGYIPPPPSHLTVAPSRDHLALIWPPVPGATSYNILRAPASGDLQILARNLPGPVAGSSPLPVTYVDSTAARNSAFTYAVQSVNPAGVSVNSAPAHFSPPTATVISTAP